MHLALRLALGLGCWLALAAAAFGQTPDHILARAYWQDVSAQASFETASKQTYVSYQRVLNRGYSGSAHWVKLSIAASDQALGLRITPAWLDSITLFDPVNSPNPITVGDRAPIQRNALPGLGHSFELPPSTINRDIWLRLQTTSSHFLSIEAIPVDQVAQASTRQIVWGVLYAAVLLLILFVLTFIWWAQRDKVLGAYLLRHAFYTYYGAAYLGLPTLLLSDWLPPAFFDLAFSFSAIIIAPVGILFDVLFLSGYRPQRHLLWMLKAIGLMSLGVLLTLLAGHVREALQANILVLMAATVVMTLTALSTRPAPSTQQIMPKAVMVTYYLLIFSSLLIGLVNMLGWVEVQSWTLYVLILHGLVSGLMMAGILLIRAQRMANLNRQMGWQLQKAQKDTTLAQHQRLEQSQFLHMLMHELKTPLSVVSLALGTQNNREENLGHAGRAVQDMKAIIDRCVQADQFGQVTLPRQLQTVDPLALIQQHTVNAPLLDKRLQVTTPKHLPLLQTDQQLLQIILNNLLSNASSYSDPLTDVTVHVKEEKRQSQSGLSIGVGNTPGVAGWPDEQQLFNKYYRAGGAQRESGSGLGLFLSRQLAHSLGGTLDYTPSSNIVEFTLWIPLSPA